MNLFWRYGIKSVTMDDIAKDLGISKRTIYQHFKDKNEIVEKVIKSKLNDEECQMQELEENSLNPIDEIVNISTHIRESLGSMNPSVLFDLKKYHPEGWALFREFKKSMVIQSVRDNLIKGQQAGLFRLDIDVEVLSRLRIEQIEMAFDPSIFAFGQFDIVEVQIQFLDHFVRGILSPEGFNYYNQLPSTATQSNTHEK
ncbi:AcrR family transcriptional regulator [Dyadobacter jejuensis]|uniref:AcrR family transcriptional regulator n=2 Tax=Dyadobacter jejuensis TaxID=1082580 RepID=A0A316AX23_9BACT|nr:AcrR family transcriptional regulator [Dyadobacter jejuensis]